MQSFNQAYEQWQASSERLLISFGKGSSFGSRFLPSRGEAGQWGKTPHFEVLDISLTEIKQPHLDTSDNSSHWEAHKRIIRSHTKSKLYQEFKVIKMFEPCPQLKGGIYNNDPENNVIKNSIIVDGYLHWFNCDQGCMGNSNMSRDVLCTDGLSLTPSREESSRCYKCKKEMTSHMLVFSKAKWVKSKSQYDSSFELINSIVKKNILVVEVGSGEDNAVANIYQVSFDPESHTNSEFIQSSFWIRLGSYKFIAFLESLKSRLKI